MDSLILAHCIKCGRQYSVAWLRQQILKSTEVPRCNGPPAGRFKRERSDEGESRQEISENKDDKNCEKEVEAAVESDKEM